jgi:hypothetical protein
MSDSAIRVESLSRLYPSTGLRAAPLWGRAGRIGRAQSHGDSLWSQRHDTLCDALAACFRRADQVTHFRSADSRSTRQLLGESYAIAGDVERAAALWRTVDVSQGQLGLRAWWYEQIGERENARLVREASQ